MEKKLAIIALNRYDRRVIKNTLAFAMTRGHNFSLVSKIEDIKEDACAVIVNGQAPTALAFWQRLAESRAEEPLLSIVVDPPAEGLPKPPDWTLHRPLNRFRLLPIFEEIEARTEPAESPDGEAEPGYSGPADIQAAPPGPPQTATTGSETSWGRVLLVDDSEVIRRQVISALERLDLEADTAATAGDALERLNEAQYDLLLLDVTLPDDDGFNVCKAIKDGRLAHMPIVMLTAKSSPFDRVRGSMAGCNMYLTKPVEFELLRKTLVRYIGTHSSRAAGPSG